MPTMLATYIIIRIIFSKTNTKQQTDKQTLTNSDTDTMKVKLCIQDVLLRPPIANL